MLDRRSARRWRALLIAASGLLLGLLGGAQCASAFDLYSALDLDGLSARGVRWESASRDGVQWTLRGVSAPGIAVGIATITLGAPPRIRLTDVAVDLAQLLRGRGPDARRPGQATDGGAAKTSAGFDFPEWLIDVAVEDLRISWARRTLAKGLHLRLEEHTLSAEGPTLSGTAEFDGSNRLWGVGRLDLGWLRARLELDLRRDQEWPIQVRLRQVRLASPHVSPQPVRLPGIDARAGRDATAGGAWRGAVSAGPLSLFGGTSCPADGACALVLSVPQTPLAELLSEVPELVALPRTPVVRGNVSVDARYRLAGGPLALDVQLSGVRVRGTGADIEAYRHGRFEILGWGANGDPKTFSSGDGSRDWVPLDDVAPTLVAALKAAEDGRFEHHPGYDVRAMAEVVEAVVNQGRRWRGASTLTQQLVKNLFLNPLDCSLQRKLQELLIAAELDRALGKARVLELYLNVVEWGPGIYGIGAACEYYLGRQAYDLTPAEAAWLVTALPSPRRFHAAWKRGASRGEERVNRILRRMYHIGALTEDEVETALLEPLPRRCAAPAGSCS